MLKINVKLPGSCKIVTVNKTDTINSLYFNNILGEYYIIINSLFERLSPLAKFKDYEIMNGDTIYYHEDDKRLVVSPLHNHLSIKSFDGNIIPINRGSDAWFYGHKRAKKFALKNPDNLVEIYHYVDSIMLDFIPYSSSSYRIDVNSVKDSVVLMSGDFSECFDTDHIDIKCSDTENNITCEIKYNAHIWKPFVLYAFCINVPFNLKHIRLLDEINNNLILPACILNIICKYVQPPILRGINRERIVKYFDDWHCCYFVLAP